LSVDLVSLNIELLGKSWFSDSQLSFGFIDDCSPTSKMWLLSLTVAIWLALCRLTWASLAAELLKSFSSTLCSVS
jgi:hypothetical protein